MNSLKKTMIDSGTPFGQITKNWSSREEIFPGIWVYRDVFKKELNLIDRLENILSKSNGAYEWQEARVGYREKIPEYRDCVDFKIRKLDYPNKNSFELALDDIWQDAYDSQLPAVTDYCNYMGVKMEYWEAMNFIKYGPGQHFQEHADHGFSYVATVSLVGYLNDDYEEGGLSFGKLDVNIKPKAGDLYIFPSTYLFSHRAMPVKSGIKYSVVTMLDYNDNAHGPDFNKRHDGHGTGAGTQNARVAKELGQV